MRAVVVRGYHGSNYDVTLKSWPQYVCHKLGMQYFFSKAWTFLFGEGKFKEIIYKVIFCLFTVLGSILSLKQVVGFSDSMIFAMSIPNIIGLYFLSSGLKKDLKKLGD